MLVPRFTIRWIFALTAVCAVFSLVISWAIRGSAASGGVAVAVASLGLLFLVHAALFIVLNLIARALKDIGLLRPTATPTAGMPQGQAARPSADATAPDGTDASPAEGSG